MAGAVQRASGRHGAVAPAWARCPAPPSVLLAGEGSRKLPALLGRSAAALRVRLSLPPLLFTEIRENTVPKKLRPKVPHKLCVVQEILQPQALL